MKMSQSSTLRAKRPREHHHNLLGRERVKRVYFCTRKQRGDHLEGRIFCSRSDQDDVAALYIWQKSVLLCFVEAMNFVHEQYRALAALPGLSGIGHHRFDLFNTAQ